MKKPFMHYARHSFALCLLLSAWGVPVNAANDFSYLADPTKPPEGFGPVTASTNATTQQAGGGAVQSESTGKNADNETTKQALTLIRIDVRTGQGMAIWNGRMVRVGDRIEDARVTAINATGVELDTPKGKRKYSLWESANVTDLMTDAASKDGGKDKP